MTEHKHKWRQVASRIQCEECHLCMVPASEYAEKRDREQQLTEALREARDLVNRWAHDTLCWAHPSRADTNNCDCNIEEPLARIDAALAAELSQVDLQEIRDTLQSALTQGRWKWVSDVIVKLDAALK